MKISASITMAGDDALKGHLEMAFDSAGRSLVQFSFTVTDAPQLNMNSQFGSDGEIAWEQKPLIGADGGNWSLLEMEDLSERVSANNWLGRLLQLGNRIDSMRTIGTTRFNDATCWEVKFTAFDGQPMAAFFDQKTRLLHGFRRSFTPPLGPEDTEAEPQMLNITFSQWRPVGDLTLFHRVQLDQAGTSMQINYDTLQINDVAADTFTVPPQVRALLPAPPTPPTKAPPNDG